VNTNELLEDYKQEAIQHGICSEEGDSRRGNKAYDKLHKILKEIKDQGEESRLIELFNDENRWVQLWAASHCLEFEEKKSLKKLKQIKKEKLPHISSDAEYTIMEWKENK